MCRGYKRLTLILSLLPILVWAEIEQVWTDFSPKPEVIEIVNDETPTVDPDIQPSNIKGSDKEGLNKEKYRVYFEDRELVLMVLGGIRWWYDNCGTLSATGNYFMNAAMVKHEITEEEMNKSLTYQTGHFAAALYNDCDVFLEQTGSIGLDMMLMKTPQEIELDPVPETNI